jgi:hypothetical protein
LPAEPASHSAKHADASTRAKRARVVQETPAASLVITKGGVAAFRTTARRATREREGFGGVRVVAVCVRECEGFGEFQQYHRGECLSATIRSVV